jgi:hypothetical protein
MRHTHVPHLGTSIGVLHSPTHPHHNRQSIDQPTIRFPFPDTANYKHYSISWDHCSSESGAIIFKPWYCLFLWVGLDRRSFVRCSRSRSRWIPRRQECGPYHTGEQDYIQLMSYRNVSKIQKLDRNPKDPLCLLCIPQDISNSIITLLRCHALHGTHSTMINGITNPTPINKLIIVITKEKNRTGRGEGERGGRKHIFFRTTTQIHSSARKFKKNKCR